MINDKPFERWFEQREPNGLMRCDNIYDAVVGLETSEQIYDFVESMMLAAWSAGVTSASNSKE
jgi:hypothetical protein